MSIPFFSVSLLEAVFGDHLPPKLVGSEAPTAFELEYAHRAGYRLGPSREWIANTTALELCAMTGEHARCDSAHLVRMVATCSLISLSSERSKS